MEIVSKICEGNLLSEMTINIISIIGSNYSIQ